MNKSLALAALPLLAPVALCQDFVPSPNPTENAARRSFAANMAVFNKKGEWGFLLQRGRVWQKWHPSDPNGWWTSAWGAYNLGDVDTAIHDYRKGDALDHWVGDNAPLKKALRIRAHYPHLHLKPLQFALGDIKAQEAQWHAKGVAMIRAKRYDEIEKSALALQKSNAHSAKGTPFLRYFFEGLCGKKDEQPTPQTALAAWQKARPHSDLARLVAIQWWTDAAWRIRGGGYADTVSPETSQKVDAYIASGLQSLRALPMSAFNSPLAFDAALAWGQIAGAPREFLDKTFAAGAHKFPNYQPIFRMRALLLMQRWVGEPGELEAFVAHRANALGGAKGDIFYARMIWTQMDYYRDVWKESAFSYPRFKRGMLAICKAEPASFSAPNALMCIAITRDDVPTVKAFFASPRGYLIDKSWWSAPQQINLSASRMEYLAQ